MPNKSQPNQSQPKSQMPPKKVYSREFKLEAFRLLRSSGKTKADIERGKRQNLDLGLVYE